MNIAIIGTGYVGLPSGVGFAELGHNVTCIDRDEKKIKKLKESKVTLYEDGLEELLEKNCKNKKIKFTTSMEEGISSADIVLIAVGTPPHPITHEADLQYVYAAATELAQYLQGYTVIATKSTVPVGTGDVLERLISKTNPKANFEVISLPEFLREGYAMHDFFNPDRIIVGVNSAKAQKLIKDLYAPLNNEIPILYVNRRSSETIKYASNSFLAIKIHYINEIANFCEKTGANVLEVAKGMGLDSRIGNKFLNPGPGFGGSCFPKDTMAMSYMAKQNNVKMTLIDAAIEGNKQRKKEIASRIKDHIMKLDATSIKIAILGLAFKEGTDDCRQSPAIEIIENLLSIINHNTTKISVYDPKAINSAKILLGEKVEYAQSIESCVNNANCLVILTEWPEFKNIDFNKLKELMINYTIIDCRNLLDKKYAKLLNFDYHGLGI